MWSALLLAALATGTTAMPTQQLPPISTVHEARESLVHRKTGRVEADSIIPVRIALVQSNLDRGYDHLMSISHPASDLYGKHWTAEQVEKEFAPRPQTVNDVVEWLLEHRIDGVKSTRPGWVAFDASTTQFESIFNTKLHEYQDTDGNVYIGCDEYSLPPHLTTSIDFITPGVKLSPPVSKVKVKRDDGSWAKFREPSRPRQAQGNPHQWGPWQPPPGTEDLPHELQQCGRNITPPCIQALYNIPEPGCKIAEGALGIYENADVYSQKNLNEYFAKYAPYVPQGTHPKLVSINGARAPVPLKNATNMGESDVDFDIAYSLLGDVPITLYQVQAPSEASSKSLTISPLADPLLAAIDGSYCDDELRQDGFQCGGVQLTEIVSISYGGTEVGNSYRSQHRACHEIMKLSLQGHTFVVSSGDYGVASNPKTTSPTGSPCDSNGCLPRESTANVTAHDRVFSASFPQSCPYVLTVGATQLNPEDTVRSPESAMYQPDAGLQQQAKCRAPEAFFSSSGGFSNFFQRPSYQSKAVKSYFEAHDPGYPSYSLTAKQASNLTAFPNNGIYNRAGRGIPDVSANGASFNIFVQNITTQTAGTSLATPIWAAMLSMVNQARKEAGKSCLGFINPVLYEHPEIFHDITKGSNPGCGTAGFSAVEGWDPVTGLGTPDYPSLLKVFMSLP